MEWKDVSPEEAAQNKYYGVGGWLLCFYAVAVIGFVGSFLRLFNVAAVKQSFDGQYGIVLGLSVIQGLLHLPFLILAAKKDPLMPKAAISAYWFRISLSAIAALVVGPEKLLQQVLVGVIYVALLQQYFNKSKRVNVTYRHRVPAG